MTTLTPRIHGQTSAVVLNDAQARLSDVRRHLQGVDPAASRIDQERTTSAWLELLGGDGSYRHDGAYDTVHTNLSGLLLGTERNNGNWILGAALAVSENRYKARHSADKGESDSQQGWLYTVWNDPHHLGGLHLNAVVGGGLVQLEAERSIPFAARKAESEHDGNLFSAALSGGYRFDIGGWSLDPTLGLSYVHLREESFREQGADGADLAIGTRDNDSLQSLVGLSLSRPIQLFRLRPVAELQAEWRHEFARKSEAVSANLVGGGRFATPGRDPAADGLLLGVALGTRLTDRLYGGLSYSCDLQSAGGATSHSLNLRIAARF